MTVHEKLKYTKPGHLTPGPIYLLVFKDDMKLCKISIPKSTQNKESNTKRNILSYYLVIPNPFTNPDGSKKGVRIGWYSWFSPM